MAEIKSAQNALAEMYTSIEGLNSASKEGIGRSEIVAVFADTKKGPLSAALFNLGLRA